MVSGWLAEAGPVTLPHVSLPLGAAIGFCMAAFAAAAGWALGRRCRPRQDAGAGPAPEAGTDPGAQRIDRRLAEVHRMTGGLAHEIKNPLSTIGLNVQLLREDLDDIQVKLAAAPGQDAEEESLSRVQRRLEGVHRETARLRDILDDFLRFAGRIRLDLGETDVDATVEELADFFTPEAASRGIRLQTDLSCGGTPLRADAGLLKQAILNLLMNAVQAMAPDDRPAGEPAGVRGELLVRSQPDPSGTHVRIEVVDTGPGIPEDRLERIFEPYHTGRRGGSGLGLPTSRRIVELHGGTLDVHSEPGKGTAFTLVLPLVGPETSASEAS